MNKVRSELLFIAGIVLLSCTALIKDNNTAYVAFAFNGLCFVIRSFIVDCQEDK